MKINIVAPEDVEKNIKNCIPTNGEKNFSYCINGTGRKYDAIVVLQSTRGYKLPVMQCIKGNSLLIIYEPQDILRLSSKYLKQFSYVLTPNQKIKGTNTIYRCFGQFWTMDKSYDEISSLKCPVTKLDKLSAVISTKTMTLGHKNRLNFVRALKAELNESFDWFGKGVREVEDKWEAISPYKYHLVFENGKWPDYWTEKLTDAFMGFSMPIYVGCTNLEDYFSPKSYVSLNDIDPCVAAEQIRVAINDDLYTKSFNHLVEARKKILNQYGIFSTIKMFVGNYFSTETSGFTTIRYSDFKNTVHRHYPLKAIRKARNELRSLVK